MASRRGHGDDGDGVYGTSLGILVFLVLLLAVMQVLLGLYTRTVAAGAAFDAATYLAHNHSAAGFDEEGARDLVDAQVNADRVLPGTGPTYEAGFVTYTVRVKPPTFLSGEWWKDSQFLERGARVRIEERRGS